MPRRVVITGMGFVTPVGIGKERFWDAISHGRGAGGPITRFDPAGLNSRIAAEIPDFDPCAAGLSEEQIARSDRATQLALAASYEALADSGLRLETIDRAGLGVCVSSAIGAIGSLDLLWRQVMHLDSETRVEGDVEAVDSIWYTRGTINRPSIVVAQVLGAHNMCSSITAACATGLEAAGLAWRAIRNGEADLMFAGGSDAAINYTNMAGFCAMGALTKRNDDPSHASRPFDADRDGFLMSEGSAVLVLEELEHARARKAHIYAEIVGYGSTANAYHIAALPEDGESLARALHRSMRHGGLKPEQIGYINAHGSSTGMNDMFETAAYKQAFGEQAYKIPISSTKSMTGHSQGGISVVELGVCVLAIERDLLPPTINYEYPDPACDLDYIPNVAREAHINAALTDTIGFGGLQSAMAVVRPGWSPS
jgi:minimal PKS ketosynthase (KS/KS alpha)